jgi:hypothetical protein
MFEDGEKTSVAIPHWFRKDLVIGYEPARAHPHHATWCEWEAHKKSGAVEKGYYELIAKEKGDSWVLPVAKHEVSWYIHRYYEIRKTEKHPDNQKPKLRLLAWEPAPAGTVTNCGVISHWTDVMKCVAVFDGRTLKHMHPSRLRLIKATKWVAIQDNEKPPVCEGLVIEYRGLDGEVCIKCTTSLSAVYSVNAYRVIGLAEGWTDDPALAEGRM